MSEVVLSEWMKIMLEEIERKRLEAAQALEEARARETQLSVSASQASRGGS
jgi:hypothetical protein